MPKLREVDLYKIFETNNFIKKVDKIFNQKQKEILFAKLKLTIYPQLKTNPFLGSNIRKLRNYKPETWRYRIGNYRLFFTVDEEETIYIIDFNHRKDAY